MTPEERREKKKQQQRAYYTANREELRAKWNAYHATRRGERNAKKRAYYAANREELLDSQRRRVYGVDALTFQRLLKEQNDKCGICREPFAKGRRPNVDHDHATNRHRGLLCNACNVVLGLLKENPFRFPESANYLEYWRELHATNPIQQTSFLYDSELIEQTA